MTRSHRAAALIGALVTAGFVGGLILTGSLRITPATSGSSHATEVPAAGIKGGPVASFADIAAAALPSVVTITSTGVATEGMETPGGGDIFEFFFGPHGRGERGRPNGPANPRRQVAAGSGFLISDDGLILTNNHVVNGASKIQVTLRSREVFTAKLVG